MQNKTKCIKISVQWPYCFCYSLLANASWAATWQNQQNECARSEDSDRHVHPPSLSESSMCAHWVAKYPSVLHADSEDPDQVGRMPRLIWVLAGRTVILLVLSCRGSFNVFGHNIYWLTKETLQTFFANGSNRNVEIWYLLYSNKWIIATMLFASSIIVVYDWRFMRWRYLLKQHLLSLRLITWPILMQNVFHAFFHESC